MPVYTPSLKADELSAGLGANTFYIEDPAQPGMDPPVMIENPEVPVFIHGQMLLDTELITPFYLEGELTTPRYIKYDVGFFYEGTDRFSPMDSRLREPFEVRVGLFCPRFIVGQKWLTGRYAIRWTYRFNDTDPYSTKDTLLFIKTAGVFDRKPHTPQVDIPASVTVEAL
jgi:hypothetical protein